MRNSTLRTASCVCLGLLALGGAPEIGQAASAGTANTARTEDATRYAERFGVELDEALRRLELQREIGALNAQLRIDEADSYAGLWIEHEPSFRVVARFTSPQAESRLQSRLAGGRLAPLVELRRAALSLVELSAQQMAALRTAREANAAVDSQLSVFDNRVEVFSTDPEALDGLLASSFLELPPSVVVLSKPSLAVPLLLRGGDHGQRCTGGFTVRSRLGEVGISTAAHCQNEQRFNGIDLPLVQEYEFGPADVQWHSACNRDDVSNEFETGFGLRACTGTLLRSQVAIGTWVCKYGATTGPTCGEIESTDYAPSNVPEATPSWVLVSNGGVVGDRGDSGGPWFLGNDAIGITSGGFDPPGDVIYMPIDGLQWLIGGVRVLTEDPGPGCTIITPDPPTPLEVCLAECRADRNDCHADPEGPPKSQCTTLYNACVRDCRRMFP